METNWVELWRQLATSFYRPEKGEGGQKTDAWQERAGRFDAHVKRKLRRPDPLRDFVLSHLDAQSTALDIGAGTGSWALPLARVARQVTAVEPSPAMAALLRANAAAVGLRNVEVVPAPWEEAEVPPHDMAICSHAMYTSPDLIGFVRKMERSARRLCFLLLRVPSHDGVLGAVSRLRHGHMHDSPNFIVAYNALLSVGLYANVIIEPGRRPWTNASLDDALQRVRDHLRLGNDLIYDERIRALLHEKLTLRDGLYHWPDGMQSALVWWQPRPASG